MNTPLANRLWADLIVEELIRNGVTFFCVAPGSRSTPLVAAIAENPRAETLVHYDERGTAFAALGYARATGLPAAWITTSGTAVANGLPAVVEASVDRVPMVLVTADRPPELRRTGANQTIDQPRIFGEYVRWSFDLPAPDPSMDPASVLTTVDQLAHRALRPPSGPVHLNAMFREPFLPDEDPELPEHLDRWREQESPYTVYPPAKTSVSTSEIERVRDEVDGVRRGLVVAGRLSSRTRGEAAARLAGALGWPLLADIGSQVRLGDDSETLAPFYDLSLADEAFAERNAPEAVLHLGGGVVSKRLQRFLATHRPDPYIVVGEDPARLDPNHMVTRRVECGVVEFCDALSEMVSKTAESSWTPGWREASQKAERCVEAEIGESESVSEPAVARLVSRELPSGHGLVLASSMPVRDMDSYAISGGSFVPVAANRGASGIDGTVATAAGFARGSGRPATLVIGDLALLHDLNSLALLRGLPVTVVAINNDGGGIFSFLPVSKKDGFFEEYFGTPQGLEFRHAAAMFGLDYSSPETMSEFERAYKKAISPGSPALIEVHTDRGENEALHRRLLSAVSKDPG